MSLSTCIVGLVAEGRISKSQAQEADRLYGKAYDALKGQMGMSAAATLATERAIAALEARAVRRRLLAGLQVQTQRRIIADLDSFGGGRGAGPIDARAGTALLAGDSRARFSNVERRTDAVRARAHGMMDEILSRFSSNLLGNVRHPAQLANVLRELFGEKTGDASARELAEAWSKAAEMLRQRFNAAGGDVGKLVRWALPQNHDSMKVRRAGWETWRAAIWDKLDRAEMIDRETGLPFTDEGLDAALKDVFARIRSEGWSDREAGAAGKGALANRRSDSRFLVFKGADDWMAYSRDFGAGSAFDAMMGHVDGMSRDIAAMEILGPNPTHMLGWVKDTIEKSARTDMSPGSEAIDAAHAQSKTMDRVWAELTGAGNRPENRKLALYMSAYRSLKTSAVLGGAVVSAISDLAFQAMTRAYNGLPVASMLGDYIKLIRPGAREDHKLAVRLGLIAEEWSNRTASQSRFLGEEQTGEVARRLAEGVLRASGLARFTQAGRWAFGMEFLGTLTEARGRTLGDLDAGLRRVLDRYGIGEAEWNKIRATAVEMDRGVEWIKPSNIEDRTLGDRLLEMIATETDYAVPAADIRTKAMFNAVAPRGTLLGEIGRSALLFKSFGVSVVAMHGRRAMEIGGWNGVGYIAGLGIATTGMGALTLLLQDLRNFRDPRDATTQEFWSAAALQGGGFGIFGDFLKSAENRAGGGLVGTMAGPMLGDVQSAIDLVGRKDKTGGALRLAKGLTPGYSLWYLRTALDRVVADRIHEMSNPGGFAAARSRQAQWLREQGTQAIWSPGELAPHRAPEISNIAGGGRGAER